MTNRIEVFKEMLAADPENTMVMFGLAKEYEKTGDHGEVIKVLEQYLSKADDEGNAFLLRDLGDRAALAGIEGAHQELRAVGDQLLGP